MKPIAFYLPQYHEVEENNLWWGQGFTEWDTVRKAKKYCRNQIQPKVPLDENYYSLDDKEAKALIWQAELAKKYGVYGFAFYHYWFKDNKKMLYKPMEILKDHKEIDTRYCICWANEPWRRTWYAGNSEILIDQDYGTQKDWIEHYDYLKTFFDDERYIKENNKPVVIIYRTAAIDCLKAMINLWNELAIKDGFNGIFVISERTSFSIDNRCDCFSAYCDFEPAYTLHYRLSKLQHMKRGLKRYWKRFCNIFCKEKRVENVLDMKTLISKMGTDTSFNNLHVFPGICPSWDNTPRKGSKGMFLKKASPTLFYNKLKALNGERNRDEFVFINAWNEWSEGAFLEPDKENKYAFLESIKDALDK